MFTNQDINDGRYPLKIMPLLMQKNVKLHLL